MKGLSLFSACVLWLVRGSWGGSAPCVGTVPFVTSPWPVSSAAYLSCPKVRVHRLLECGSFDGRSVAGCPVGLFFPQLIADIAGGSRSSLSGVANVVCSEHPLRFVEIPLVAML